MTVTGQDGDSKGGGVVVGAKVVELLEVDGHASLMVK